MERYVQDGDAMLGWIVGDDQRGWKAWLCDGEELINPRSQFHERAVYECEVDAHAAVMNGYEDRVLECTRDMREQAKGLAEFVNGSVEEVAHGYSLYSFQVKNRHGDLVKSFVRTEPFCYDEFETMWMPQCLRSRSEFL